MNSIDNNTNYLLTQSEELTNRAAQIIQASSRKDKKEEDDGIIEKELKKIT